MALSSECCSFCAGADGADGQAGKGGDQAHPGGDDRTRDAARAGRRRRLPGPLLHHVTRQRSGNGPRRRRVAMPAVAMALLIDSTHIHL